MKKILILEDKKSFFIEIEAILKNYELFPTSKNKTISDNSATEYTDDYAFIKDEFFNYKSSKQKANEEDIKNRNEFFNKIVNGFSDNKIDFDYYIIDLQLKTDMKDDLGLDFINFLEKKGLNENAKTIILSQNTQPPSISSIDNEEFNKRYKFIPKEKGWEKKVLDYLGEKPDEKGNNKSSKTTSEVIFFDKVIKSFFAFLLICSIVFSFWSVVTKDFGFFNKEKETTNVNILYKNDSNKIKEKKIDTVNNSYISQVTKNKEKVNFDSYKESNKTDGDTKELKILKFAEHIFVYLIPLFIIFGFYSYYLFDFRRVLLRLPPSTEDSNSAKESIKTTKTLFLSSIMAYVIIKIIEKVFFVEVKDRTSLISYGVLLFLLMTYLLLSHIGEHKKMKE